jgi:hypothetical protein
MAATDMTHVVAVRQVAAMDPSSRGYWMVYRKMTMLNSPAAGILALSSLASRSQIIKRAILTGPPTSTRIPDTKMHMYVPANLAAKAPPIIVAIHYYISIV